MKLYDDVIKKWGSLLADCSIINLNTNAKENWPDVGSHQMILRSDMAYELGGSTPSLHAIGCTVVTDDESLVAADEILLAGPDLKDIGEDVSFARLTVALVDEAAMGQGNDLYNAIKKIGNAGYHVNPEGYMMRLSSVYNRESIRISKKAIEEGLSLEHAGNLMLRELHKNPCVRAAKIIFVTEASFDYEAADEEARKAVSITSAIDHIMKEAMTDCNTCGLKPVCDEVEGLREMHFGRKE